MLVGARFCGPTQTNPEAQPASRTMRTGSVSWRWSCEGVALTTQRFKCCGHIYKELYHYFPFVSAWRVMGQPFVHIQIPYKHITTTGQGVLKIYAVTPDCLTWHQYVQHFTQTLHRLSMSLKLSVYFAAPLTPLNLLCNSRHITTILLLGCLQIHLQSSYILLFHSQTRFSSSTSAECGVVSSCVSCSRFNISYSSFLLSIFSLWYSCGTHVCEDNIKMYFDGKGN